MQGIYAIVHCASGKRYIGSSGDFLYRWRRHQRDLRLGVHENAHLQNAWDKYGSESFEIALIEKVVNPTELLEREQAHLSLALASGLYYNINPLTTRPPSQRGRKWTEEQRATISRKVSAALLGRKRSPETLAKMSAARKGFVLSAEARLKISVALTGRPGRPCSEETRAKMRAAHNGRAYGPRPACVGAKISATKRRKRQEIQRMITPALLFA